MIRADAGLSPPLLVALTGYARERDRCDVREAEFDHYLVKPVDPALLMQILSSPLEVSSTALAHTRANGGAEGLHS